MQYAYAGDDDPEYANSRSEEDEPEDEDDEDPDETFVDGYDADLKPNVRTDEFSEDEEEAEEEAELLSETDSGSTSALYQQPTILTDFVRSFDRKTIREMIFELTYLPPNGGGIFLSRSEVLDLDYSEARWWLYRLRKQRRWEREAIERMQTKK